MQDFDDIIYHYCSQTAFFHIIKNHTMFLTHCRFLNDYNEFGWFRKLLLAYLDERHYSDDAVSLLTPLVDLLTEQSQNQYLCSFSENDSILSQWRTYGDDGRGFAIGFSRSLMRVPQKAPYYVGPDLVKPSPVGLVKVKYKTAREEKMLKEGFDSIVSNLTTDSRKHFANLSQLSLALKDSAFAEELEWRMIYTPSPHTEMPKTLSDLLGVKTREHKEPPLEDTGALPALTPNNIERSLKYRESDFGIAPYYVWNFTSLTDPARYSSKEPLRYPIVRVKLGPQNINERTVIAEFMRYYGYTVDDDDVLESNIAYRSYKTRR